MFITIYNVALLFVSDVPGYPSTTFESFRGVSLSGEIEK